MCLRTIYILIQLIEPYLMAFIRKFLFFPKVFGYTFDFCMQYAGKIIYSKVAAYYNNGAVETEKNNNNNNKGKGSTLINRKWTNTHTYYMHYMGYVRIIYPFEYIEKSGFCFNRSKWHK